MNALHIIKKYLQYHPYKKSKKKKRKHHHIIHIPVERFTLPPRDIIRIFTCKNTKNLQVSTDIEKVWCQKVVPSVFHQHDKAHPNHKNDSWRLDQPQDLQPIQAIHPTAERITDKRFAVEILN